MREALEAALSRTEFWLQVFAVVVAVGVTGEAIFGVRLWLMGRRLRAIQQSEDLKNRTEIARLRAEAEGERLARVEIEEQLIRQGSRAALLYGENRMRLIEQLKAFAGQKVEVRYCGTSLNQYFVDDEVMSVAMLLHLVFSESGWFV
ncbi:MAG: hypothetical protein LAP13_27270, partial [Acidobacteriia bacterium]|nr:hypothetical protein [Terriglobia bacterium]